MPRTIKPTAEHHPGRSPCQAGNARDVVGTTSTEAASSHPLPRDRWSQASKVAVLAACSLAVACCAPSMAQAAAAAASSGGGESFVSAVVSFVLHLDKHMSAMIARHGTATYAILGGIVFCETGLVLTPLLPGDSLLFAAGAFAGMGKLSVPLLMAVFISSAILGDAVNYAIGNKLGRWALERKIIKEQYIKQTRTFYAKHGGETVVLARFVPIVRTFAPFVAGIGSMAYSRSRKPEVIAAPTPFNTAVLSRMPSLAAEYSCTPFLTNPHVETIMAAKLRTSPYLSYRREILHMQDGGVVALDWEHFDLEEHDLPADAPVLILLPGLTGGSSDSYVLHAVQKARAAGIRAVVFNSRSTANSPVITPQFYSASFTEDTREVVRHVAAKHPSSIIFAAGWSLGANILLCYLAEEGEGTPISAAVSMCNPFDLMKANLGLKEGFSQIYDLNLASGLKKLFAKHEMLWRGVGKPFRPDLVPSARSIWEFDDYITIHSFGWHSVEEYYQGSSSCRRIPDITIPVLCLQALDDPIAPKEAIPYDAIRANPNCILATTPCGGHLGWVSGPGAPFGNPWSDEVMVEYLSSVYQELRKRDSGLPSTSRRSSSSGSSDGDGVEAEVVLTGGQAGRQRAASSSQWGQQQQQQQQRAGSTAAAEAAGAQAAAAGPSSSRGSNAAEAQAAAAAGVAGAMARVGLLSVTLNALGSAAALSAMVHAESSGQSASGASVRRGAMQEDGPSARDVAAAASLTDQLRWGL